MPRRPNSEFKFERYAWFDTQAFVQALGAHQIVLGTAWREIARDIGCSNTIFHRMVHGKDCDIHIMAALLAWSGLKFEQFVRTGAKAEQEKEVV